MTATEHTGLSGREILGGRYRLQELLGEGGFGAVYSAHEIVLGKHLRTVAIKLTHRKHLNAEDADALLAEARTLAKVAEECPLAEGRKHLVQVFDLGICHELDDCGYLVMELVRGVPLVAHIETLGGTMPMSLARRYFEGLCTAVRCCHELGVLHSDLKPDNVLVDHTQTLRVADFGLAKQIDPRIGYAPGVAGTFMYMAPETVRGRRLVQSDIYSIGLIMYEALTGGGPHLDLNRQPEAGETDDMYLRKRALTFAPIVEQNQSLGEADHVLFAWVEACCAFEIKARPKTLVELLEALAENRMPPAPPPGAGPPNGWLAPARQLLEAGEHAAGLDLLTTLEESVERSAYEALFLAGLERWKEAFDVGGTLLAGDPELGASLHELLLRALVKSARALGEHAIADYYESLLGDD